MQISESDKFTVNTETAWLKERSKNTRFIIKVVGQYLRCQISQS